MTSVDDPSYGGTQAVTLAVFIGIALALAAVFVLVAMRASRPVAFERVKQTGYSLRRFWVVSPLALPVAAVITSLLLLPYNSAA